MWSPPKTRRLSGLRPVIVNDEGASASSSATRPRSTRTVPLDSSTSAPTALNICRARGLMSSMPSSSRIRIEVAWMASIWSSVRISSGG